MKYFYKDLILDVPDSLYFPREDSELLAAAIEGIDVSERQVLEIGCGSGLLSIILARKGAHVTAVDISEDAVKTAKANAEKNGVQISAAVSDMFEGVEGKFSLIVFNPPYLPATKGEINDAAYSGGSSGREVIEIFLSTAVEYLRQDGSLLLVISSLTGEHEVLSSIRKAGLEPKIAARQKIPWEELIVIEARFEAQVF